MFLGPGPAVGPGVRAPLRGINLEPDPNILRLRTERLNKDFLYTYRLKRKEYWVYKAAARLWREGIEWATALEIVSEAFDATTH
ncbi:unnamed protein product [Durusdinium trenchii]|uniref:Uncharacterized protein n=1 Tax=Durusdinium trenchii TaxID=1381693 RepID=A0ABP0ML88_9DINO